jgi:predicted MFS family arabinose efflux permease
MQHTGRGAAHDALNLLATRRFGTFWFASLLSSIGTWAQQVAEPWLLVTLGASPFLVGLDAFVADAPAWLLTLAGGALADRGDRRKIIAGYQSAQMLCPVAIVALLLTGLIRPWMVVALSLVVGVTDALSMPSFQSIVPSIVEHDHIEAALTLNSTQFNLSRILGPSIAGALIAAAGTAACFAVNAASYLPFIGVALWILPRRVAPASAPRVEPAQHTLSGVVDILRLPHLRGALVTVFITTLLCSPLVTFAPVLIKTTFQGTAGEFALTLGAFGVGGLLGAGALLTIGPELDRRRLSSGMAVLYGAIVALAALNPWLTALPALLVVAGASMTISNTAANALVQATANPEKLGRTVSLYMLAMRGGGSLGSVITGAAITALGIRRALLVNGLIAIAAQAVVGTLWARSGMPPPSRSSGTVRASF